MIDIQSSNESLIRKIFLDSSNVLENNHGSLNSLGVQSAFSWFQRVIDLHFGNSYPKRSFTLTYKNRLPWITEKLCTQIKDKNAMPTIFLPQLDLDLLGILFLLLIQCLMLLLVIIVVIPPISIAEVTQVISSLKNSSASWDKIPALVAKQFLDTHENH